jgi:maltose-binding protein MalE
MDAETVSTDSILQEFKSGTMLFTIMDSESAVELEMAKANGEISFDFDYALIPDPSSELRGRPLSVTNVVVVNGYTDYPETAVDFAEFLTMENYCTDQLYEKTGYLPAYAKSATFTNMEVVFKKEYTESANMPNYMVTSNFWMLLENAFNQLWDGAETREVLYKLEQRLQNQIPE